MQWAIYVILLRSFLHPCATAEYLPSTYFYRWYKWRTGLPYSDINLRLDKQSYENIIHNCHRHVFINNQNMGPEFFNRDSLHDSCCLGVVAFIWHQVMFSSSFFRSQPSSSTAFREKPFSLLSILRQLYSTILRDQKLNRFKNFASEKENCPEIHDQLSILLF